MTMNCWEFKQCGKENQCPAGKFEAADGFLNGKKGGTACVYITGTFCNRSIQGTYKDKEKNCAECEFYHYLRKIHGGDMSVLKFSKFIRERKTENIERFFILN